MRARRHALIAAGDQGVSSISTLVLTVGAFRSDVLPPGQTAVMLIVWSVSIGVARSLYAEPIASQAVPDARPRRERMSPASGALIGTLVIAATAQAVTVVTLAPTLAGWTIAGVLALMAGADAVRSIAQAMAHPDLALVASSLLLTGVLLGFSADALGMAGQSGVFLGAALTSLIVMVAGGWRHGDGWQDLRPRHLSYLGEYFLTSGSMQLAALLAGVLVSHSVPVTLRVGSTAFGVYLVGLQAAALMAVPLLRGPLRDRAQQHRVRASLTLTAVLLTLLATNVVLLVLIAEHGTDLFGSAWDEASGTLPFYAVSLIGGAATAGPFLLLRALDSRSDSLRLRAFSGCLQLGAPIVSGLAWGAPGFFLGALGASITTATIGLGMLHKTGRLTHVQH